MKSLFIQKALLRLSLAQNHGYKTIIPLFLFFFLFFGNYVILAQVFTGEISGSGALCPGKTAPITLTIGDGNSPFTATLTRSGSAINKDTILSGITSSPRIINVKIPGTYTLTYLTDANLNEAVISGDSVVLTEMTAPVVEIFGLLQAYEKNYNQLIYITGNPPGGTFTGPGLFCSNDSCFFLPAYAPIGPNQIAYSYRESESACYGYDTATVSIWKAIAYMEFPENRLKYCSGEEPFVIRGYNLTGDMGSFSISGGIGLTDNMDNTAVIYPSLLSSGEYSITYTYYDGTTLNVKEIIDVQNMDVSVTQYLNFLEANIDEAEYQWIDCTNDSPIDGQIDKTFILPDYGNFAVIIMKDGCVDTSFCYEVLTTDVEKQLKKEIEVYPNPGKETFYINLGNLITDTEIVITDLNGRVIQKEKYRNVQVIEIYLQAPPGSYLLRINTGKDQVIFPLVRSPKF